MKICPECHKISRDDDFCSNCGAAVFNADDVTDSRAIDCSRYDSSHSHNKITYDRSERGTTVRPPARQIPPDRTTYDRPQPSQPSARQPLARQVPDMIDMQNAENFVNDLLNGRRDAKGYPTGRDRRTDRMINQTRAKIISVIIVIVLAFIIIQLISFFSIISAMFSW